MAPRKPAGVTGPPGYLCGTAILVLLVAIVFSSRELSSWVTGPTANLLGFLTGSVLGIINLATFLIVNNNRKANPKFAVKPWRVLGLEITPEPSARLLALMAWVVGVWNVFFWALHLTRP